MDSITRDQGGPLILDRKLSTRHKMLPAQFGIGARMEGRP